uniref:Peptidase M14 domain-containing protein n=1 Tax=Timema shepardi TaxID=629360 RepID=A0A7R9B4R7_TIMSH|nr:unnamed protein product [Timema shepardi]
MDRLAVLLISFLACVSASSNFTAYDGHKVYKVFPTEYQAGLLKTFHDLEGYDFWGSYHNVSTGIQELDLMVTPEQQEYFVKFLKDKNIEYSTLVEDLETVFKAERVQQNSKRASSRISFDSYLRYDQIRAYLLQLATNYPTLVTVENIGFTYEGRPIVIAKISSGGQGSRPVIAIEAGIHAREWIAPATAVYIINQLVENSENSDLISNVDWHIVPVTNPDGYEFSHTTLHFSTSTNHDGYKFSQITISGYYSYIPLLPPTMMAMSYLKPRPVCGERLVPGRLHQPALELTQTGTLDTTGCLSSMTGASSNPCSETYGGTHAFSESETVAYHNYILGNKDRIKLYLATHSYGNYFLYPWGYTSALPSDWRNLLTGPTTRKCPPELQATPSGAPLMFSVNAAAGGSDDWVKAVGGVDYAYTLELPGGGNSGFDLPASQIARTVSTFFPAIRTRLWRKTRSRPSSSTCIGTDANRNFDYFWITRHAGTKPTHPSSVGMTRTKPTHPSSVGMTRTKPTHTGSVGLTRTKPTRTSSVGMTRTKPTHPSSVGMTRKRISQVVSSIWPYTGAQQCTERRKFCSRNLETSGTEIPDAHRTAPNFTIGASSNPCSETYGGTHAFSEPETVAYHNYILGNKDRIKLYLATHSYGNYILYSWGHTSALPSDWLNLDNLAKRANNAQVSAGAPSYSIDATGGASVDWVKAVAGVGYGYTIELPGGGSFGFDLPASRILSTVSAYFNAVRVFGEYIRDNYA